MGPVLHRSKSEKSLQFCESEINQTAKVIVFRTIFIFTPSCEHRLKKHIFKGKA